MTGMNDQEKAEFGRLEKINPKAAEFLAHFADADGRSYKDFGKALFDWLNENQDLKLSDVYNVPDTVANTTTPNQPEFWVFTFISALVILDLLDFINATPVNKRADRMIDYGNEAEFSYFEPVTETMTREKFHEIARNAYPDHDLKFKTINRTIFSYNGKLLKVINSISDSKVPMDKVKIRVQDGAVEFKVRLYQKKLGGNHAFKVCREIPSAMLFSDQPWFMRIPLKSYMNNCIERTNEHFFFGPLRIGFIKDVGDACETYFAFEFEGKPTELNNVLEEYGHGWAKTAFTDMTKVPEDTLNELIELIDLL